MVNSNEALWIRGMEHAISCARKAWGMTHPNPMVGAVILEKGAIVAEGYHRKAGEDHAEVAVLKNLNRKPQKDAVLIVTLEPCSTTGKTPPCVEAILNSGIRKVIIGTEDPNPNHCGRGIALLRQSGITVQTGILQETCEDLNLIFNHWIVQRKPFIAAKIATTLDGKIATLQGGSKWITGEKTREDVMHWRRLFSAIGVGAQTAIQDNPSLTSRLHEITCPIRVIFDRKNRIQNHHEVGYLSENKPTQKLFVLNDPFKDKTILMNQSFFDSNAKKDPHLNWNPPFFWETFKNWCFRQNIYSVLLEGGSGLLQDALQSKAIDYMFAYRAPKILGNGLDPFGDLHIDRIEDALSLKKVKHAFFSEDQLIRGFVSYQ